MEKRPLRESSIENYFIACAKRHGGLTVKFTSPGNSGIMDRVYIHPDGRIWFPELKRPGENLRDLQAWWFSEFRRVNANPIMLDTKEKIDMFFNAIK